MYITASLCGRDILTLLVNYKWFQFDDSMVTLATEKQVLAAQAYLLVYIIRTLS
jgi:hypothetical protein